MIELNASSPKISVVTGKFIDKRLEQLWIAENNNALKKELRPMILLVSLIFLLFLLPDYRLISNLNILGLLTISRLLFVFISLLLYFKADYFLSVRLAYSSITLYEVIGTIIFFVITYNYQSPNFLIQSIGLVTMVLGIFFVIPNLFIFKVLIALFISLGFMIIAALKFSFTLNEFSAVAVFLTIIIGLSTISAYRLCKFQKLSYVHKKDLIKLSNTDPLTHLNNRIRFNQSLSDEINLSKNLNTIFSIILFDIDWFKKINDNYGHNVGDDVLVELGQLVKRSVRDKDLLARWGGEEFIILLHNTAQTDALELAQRLRITIEQHSFLAGCLVTCCFGVTSFMNGDDIRSVIERADKALYRAKNGGRNNVVLV